MTLQSSIKRTILAIFALVTGTALAHLSVPFLLRHAHDETARLATILDACHSAANPSIVILGNSTGMFGVDARQLTRSLPGQPLAFNFCSPAQSLGQALRFEHELPASAKTVVQLVAFWQLEDDFVDNELHLDDRRNIRAALESFARDLARPDPDRDRGLHDLYYPAPLHPRRSGYLPAQLFAELEHPAGPYAPNKIQIDVLREIAKQRSVLFVLAPMHPRVRALRPDLLPRFREAMAATNASVLDLTELLDANEFIDPTHATLSGARRVTAAIGRRLATP